MPMNGSMGMRGKLENLIVYDWDPLWVGRQIHGLHHNNQYYLKIFFVGKGRGNYRLVMLLTNWKVILFREENVLAAT